MFPIHSEPACYKNPWQMNIEIEKCMVCFRSSFSASVFLKASNWNTQIDKPITQRQYSIFCSVEYHKEAGGLVFPLLVVVVPSLGYSSAFERM